LATVADVIGGRQ